MHLEKLPYAGIPQFSKLFQNYIRFSPELEPFVSGFPTIGAIARQVEAKRKQFSMADRERLHRSVSEQYQHLNLTKKQAENLKSLLSPDTFSVSCGHQLNIAGGPWYVLYKLLSICVYADRLNSQYPNLHFVPIFWLASEDHDLAEISTFQYFSKTYNFDLKAEGAAGRVSTEAIVQQLAEIPDLPEFMKQAYKEAGHLSEATRLWIQYILGEKGILCLDAAAPELKEKLLPLALAELEQANSERLIQQCTSKLEQSGYKAQIHPREINLFYLDEHYRGRLERENGKLFTTDRKHSWTLPEARAFFSAHPEKLSPNVALRPLYSQLILPDVAFVGGPAEISYWLQLKDLFDDHDLLFPLLIPRFSGLYLLENQAKKLKKLDLKAAELFQEIHHIKKEKIIPSYGLPRLADCYAELLQATQTIDPTLVPAFEAELAKIEKQVENLEKRLKKAAEQKNEFTLQQISGLQQRLFPQGGLQERQESWLSALANNPNLIEQVERTIEPFDFQFVIFSDAQVQPSGV